MKLNTCLLPTVLAKNKKIKPNTVYLFEFFFFFKSLQKIPCQSCLSSQITISKKNSHFHKEFPYKIDFVTLNVLHGSEHLCIHRKPQSLFIPGRLNVTRAT